MEVWDVARHGVMLPITVLVGLVTLYWLLVILGAVGFDALDLPVDGVPEGDLDAGTAAGTQAGSWVSALRFFHLGEVPFMVFLSVFALSWWVSTGFGLVLFGERFTGPWAVLWIGPCFLIGLLVTKAVLMPTSRFFAALDGSRDAQPELVGRTCIVTSSEVTDTFGQAEVKIEGPPIIIDVRSAKGDVFHKGDFARIEERNSVTRAFLIRPIVSEESDS